VSAEDIISDLRANVKQDFKITRAQTFFMNNKLSQLYEPNAEDIVRNIWFKDLLDVMNDCFGVEVFIYINRMCRISVF